MMWNLDVFLRDNAQSHRHIRSPTNLEKIVYWRTNITIPKDIKFTTIEDYDNQQMSLLRSWNQTIWGIFALNKNTFMILMLLITILADLFPVNKQINESPRKFWVNSEWILSGFIWILRIPLKLWCTSSCKPVHHPALLGLASHNCP